jgi:type I restriction enzyme R subunit
MIEEDLATKFKNPNDPFRLVFVCAMWMTGFDAPSCSTIYVDKPMRNHTLMQTIARANRVFQDKVNGLIVDYVGVFRDLQRALAIYGSGSGGGIEPGDTPVQHKAELVKHLQSALTNVLAFLRGLGVDVDGIRQSEGFERIRLLDDAVEALLLTDDTRREFLAHAAKVGRLFKAVLPDPIAAEVAPNYGAIRAIELKLRTPGVPVDITHVMAEVEALLDRSISAEGYVIRHPAGEGDAEHRVDLSRIDFDALAKRFEDGRKRTEADRLRRIIEGQVQQMVRRNRTREEFLARFQQMIEEYNSGAINADELFERLVQFAKELKKEDQRAVAESLTEEQLAIFDLLLKPRIELTKREEQQVKEVARELLETLKREKLVLDWRKKQQSQAAVRLTIEEQLDRLPEKFTVDLYRQKCDMLYRHVYESYFGAGKSIYEQAA